MSLLSVKEGLIRATTRVEPKTFIPVIDRPIEERPFPLGTARAGHEVGTLGALFSSILRFLVRGTSQLFLSLARAGAK